MSYMCVWESLRLFTTFCIYLRCTSACFYFIYVYLSIYLCRMCVYLLFCCVYVIYASVCLFIILSYECMFIISWYCAMYVHSYACLFYILKYECRVINFLYERTPCKCILICHLCKFTYIGFVLLCIWMFLLSICYFIARLIINLYGYAFVILLRVCTCVCMFMYHFVAPQPYVSSLLFYEVWDHKLSSTFLGRFWTFHHMLLITFMSSL